LYNSFGNEMDGHEYGALIVGGKDDWAHAKRLTDWLLCDRQLFKNLNWAFQILRKFLIEYYQGVLI